MDRLQTVSEEIKVIKQARDILKQYYTQSDFHKKKEKFAQEVMPSSPQDEEIYKLLTAIQQLDSFLKKLQDEQFVLLKKHEEE